MTASLSCPEVARMCLLDDDAMELVAYFADRVKDVYFRGTTSFSQDVLVEEARRISDPEVVAELCECYRQRKARWLEHHRDLLKLTFENYSRSYWLRTPYTRSKSLLHHMCSLLVRRAILQLLLFGNPRLECLARADHQLDTPEARLALEEAIVETFYLFARNIEHHGEYLDAVEKHLDIGDRRSLATAVFLIGF